LDAGGENNKFNDGMVTTGEKRRTSKENMDGRVQAAMTLA
jgi:hypothetical protein